MRTLTELSGEYVRFDQNVRKCSFAFDILSTRKEQLTWKIDGFNTLPTLVERLGKSERSENSGFFSFQEFEL